jgi:glucose/arabinose dehydrogenase
MILKSWRQRFACLSASFLVIIQTFIPVFTLLLTNSKDALAAPPANFTSETLLTNLNEPTAVSFLPDGRMLVLERYGRVHLAEAGASTVNPTAFIDLTTNTNTDQGERGLTGIAVDPQFATNGYVYFFYTSNSPLRDRVSRFTVTGNIASPATEQVIWQDDVVAPFWHHGGTIGFGSDGMLYISTGDGFDRANESQLLSSYRGKILRINSNGTIPTDNPFYDGAGTNKDEVWALGLRNPFRFQFDSQTGSMYIGDVGGNDASQSDEEINGGASARNFGWPICEGQNQSPGGGACTPPSSPGTYTSPFHTYPHGGSDASVTGGFVYRGGNFPAPYKDSYFYGDYVRNWVKGITLDPSTGDKTGEFNFEPATGTNNGPYGEIVDIKQGPDGALYYVDIGISWEGGANPGTVRRIKYTSSNQPPVISQAQASVTSGANPLTVNFLGTATDPENNTLTYSWNFGDGSALSTEQNPTHIYTTNGQFTARLTVSDGTNQTLSDPISIIVGTPPVITNLTVTSPSDQPGGEITFRAGDIINYSGSATDADGTLTSQNYEWRITLIHLSHTHPEAGPINATSGNFNIPSSGHDINDEIQFQFILKVTDADGLSVEQAVNILPETVDLLLQSNPSGLTINVDGLNRTTPSILNTVVNFQHALSATTPQTLSGTTYNFSTWSDNGSQTHTITAPQNTETYTANFQAVSSGPTPLLGYALDETSGTTATSAFGTNNLSLANGPVWSTQGRYNGALSFDGSNDRATGSSVTIPGTFTVMGWIFNPTNSPYETVLTIGSNRDMYVNNGVLGFYDGTNDRSFGSAMSTNAWHHVSIVSTGTQQLAYVDGVQAGSPVNTTLGSYSGNVQLGAWINGGSYFDFLSGRLDDVRIYNSALTQSEIQSAMNSGIGGQPPINQAPTANNQSVSTTINTALPITLTATDPENNMLSYTVLTNPTNGTLSGTAPNLVYTPTNNFTENDSFTFRANDGQANSNTATISITVNDVSSAGYALDFNGNGTGDIDRLKIPLDNPQTPIDVGTSNFTIEWWMKANDSDNAATSCIPGNDGWINGNIIVDRDVFGNGDYGDYGVSMFGNGLAFGVNNGTTGAGVCGDIQVDDGQWHHVAVSRRFADGQLSLYVDGVLDAQIDGPDGDISYRNNRNSSFSNDPYLVIGAEKHDAGVEYPSYNGQIDELRISSSLRYSGNFTSPANAFTPDSNTVGLYHFNEGSGTTIQDAATIVGAPTNGQINVGGNPVGPIYVASSAPIGEEIPNQAPNAVNDSASTSENTPVNINVLSNDSDPESQTLLLLSVSDPTNGTTAIISNEVVYTPDSDFVGNDSFTYTINDGAGGEDSALVNVTVTQTNDAPIANDDTGNTNEDNAVTVTVLANDSDPNNDALTVSIIQQPTNGVAVRNANNTITYTPTSNTNGSDSYIYQVNDGNGGTDTAVVNINVAPVNDIPVADNQSLTTPQNTPRTITLSGTDVDNDLLNFSILTNPTSGTLSGTAPNLTYTPNTGFSGNDTFTFRANDGTVNSNTATITITVQSSYNPFSLSFDGGDFARFTDIPLSQQYTYEAWVYRTVDSGGYETFLSDANTSYNQAMFTLYVDGASNDCSGANDQFAYYQSANGSTQCSGVTAQIGQWYHVAVTRDATNTRRIFINGQLTSTVTNSPNASNSNGRVNIGRAGDNNSEYFRGIVDEVRISNISRYVGNFVPQTSNFISLPNTVALYHLDAGTGQTLSDSSGNNRNGTRGAGSSTESTDPTWATQSPIVSN